MSCQDLQDPRISKKVQKQTLIQAVLVIIECYEHTNIKTYSGNNQAKISELDITSAMLH